MPTDSVLSAVGGSLTLTVDGQVGLLSEIFLDLRRLRRPGV
jgi:hypothetical protein